MYVEGTHDHGLFYSFRACPKYEPEMVPFIYKLHYEVVVATICAPKMGNLSTLLLQLTQRAVMIMMMILLD